MPPRTVLNELPASQPAQPAPKPKAQPAAKPTKPSPAVPAKPAANATAPSILNQAAQPAKVSLASGKLTVEAHNSNLSDILRQIAKAGSMKIDGLPANAAAQRIFGQYGPGTPREVLTDLLTGSGYNIVMAGLTPSGTPRELSLSLRAAGGAPSPATQPAEQDQETETPDQGQPTEYPDEQQDQPQPPTPPTAQNRVRTPEQILQELQRMNQQRQPQ
ncbi:MAG: hypothetical protein WBD10_16375 [Acidobacteriaceae bacterium]